MDYKQFFLDVVSWINECNNRVKEFGFNSSELWDWVSFTLAKLCEKYNNHDLAQAQSIMLWNWLENKKEEFNIKNGAM